MEDKNSPKSLIVKSLREKSSLKQDVFHLNIQIFQQLKAALKEIAAELRKETQKFDKRLVIEYKDEGEYECRFRIAGDVLIFQMHTNVFRFDDEDSLWKTSYLKEKPERSYCGVINVYNFLSDSFKQDRMQDLGYLIARVFVNAERHFFVQGKRQLGFLYNDFVNSEIDEQKIRSVLMSAILYTLNFDLYTPSYDSVKEVTVEEMKALSMSLHIKTGKRLGFRFQHDHDEVQ